MDKRPADNAELHRTLAALDSSRARYFDFYDLAPVGYCTVSERGLIQQANLSTATLLGVPRAALIQQRLTAFISGQDQDSYYLFRKQLLETGEARSCELRMVKNDGAPFWADLAAIAAQDKDGAPVLRIVLSDITARQQAQQQLMASTALLNDSLQHNQALLDNMVCGVITIDAQGLIESFNKGASSIFGYAVEEVLGRDVAMLMPEPHRSQHDRYLQHYLCTSQNRIIGRTRDVEGQRKDGNVFPMSLSVSQIARAGQTTFIGIALDLSQSRQDEEDIHRLAFYDPLTALPNRRLLMDHVHQAMLTSARTGQYGALLLLDLDHFKQLNDTLGLEVGDLLLQQVAARLKAGAREGDRVARLGGDEFVVLMEALSSQPREAAAQAEDCANKILKTLGQPYTLRGHSCCSTPSIGIVEFLGTGQSLDDLLKQADIAMYQAKNSGRDTACFFDADMQAAAVAHAARVS
ncbi:diguanylate cyclase domain-containing protein, partial [Rhodoferax sp. UBA5149]|uniref:diguanylate cyclase domain-containing protein n=1 Tax=Rhodoferax sp. UBA5149 TaxID=1947379 RepID=UPI0025DB94F9